MNEVDTTAITRSILKGFLRLAGGDDVNEVNAPAFAEAHGIRVTESRLSAPGDYTDLLELTANAEGKTVPVAGAFFGAPPPTGLGAFNDNYATSLYSIRDRYYYVSMTKKF